MRSSRAPSSCLSSRPLSHGSTAFRTIRSTRSYNGHMSSHVPRKTMASSSLRGFSGSSTRSQETAHNRSFFLYVCSCCRTKAVSHQSRRRRRRKVGLKVNLPSEASLPSTYRWDVLAVSASVAGRHHLRQARPPRLMGRCYVQGGTCSTPPVASWPLDYGTALDVIPLEVELVGGSGAASRSPVEKAWHVFESWDHCLWFGGRHRHLAAGMLENEASYDLE